MGYLCLEVAQPMCRAARSDELRLHSSIQNNKTPLHWLPRESDATPWAAKMGPACEGVDPMMMARLIKQARSGMLTPSEVKFQTELELPGVIGLRDFSETSATQIAIRRAKICFVQQIESFGAELQG